MINKPEIPIYKFPNVANYSSPVYFIPELVAPDEVFIMMTDQCVLNIMHDRYMISNYGRVWDNYRNCMIPQHFDRKGEKFNGDNKGYLYFKISYYKDPFTIDFRNVRTNRMVLLAFNYIDGCENLEANHLNGDHSDNRLCNLNWDSGELNNYHAKISLLNPSGENRYRASLTNELAHTICKLIDEGYSNIDIANMTGCPKDLPNNIRRGHSYRYISDQYNFKSEMYVDNIDRICELLSLGKNPIEISREEKIALNVVIDIASGNKYQNISKKYNLQYIDSSKLQEYLLIEICQQLAAGVSVSSISNNTGISQDIIFQIRDNKIYNEISGQYKFLNMDYNNNKEKILLPEQLVIQICEKLQNGETPINISKETGVDRRTISSIKSKHSYRNIANNYNFESVTNKSLTEDQVIQICNRLNSGTSYSIIAKEFNIGKSTVYDIRHAKTFKNITENFNFTN